MNKTFYQITLKLFSVSAAGLILAYFFGAVFMGSVFKFIRFGPIAEPISLKVESAPQGGIDAKITVSLKEYYNLDTKERVFDYAPGEWQTISEKWVVGLRLSVPSNILALAGGVALKIGDKEFFTSSGEIEKFWSVENQGQDYILTAGQNLQYSR